MKIRVLFYFSFFLISGCVTYTSVGPGELDYAGLMVQPGQAWNQAPKEATQAARTESRVWTQDGILLDRIVIIPGVPSGEPIFRQLSGSQALPVFESSMLPNEIEELTESSIVKLFGEGGVVVETTNLRPHRYGDKRGILFDMQVTVSDGPDYKGVAGALVVDQKLNLIIFLGAEPYYYQKHLQDALVIIKGARVKAASEAG
jgi:hypothetical protein